MKKKVMESVGTIIRILLGLLYISPLFVGLLFSFQPDSEIGMAPLRLFTKSPTLENYKYVFQHIPVLTYLKNTVIMILICVPCQIILASIAAFAFSFFEFPFKNALFTVYLAAMMIPGEVVIMANYMTIQNMGLLDTYLGMTITSLVGVTGIFMLRQNMKSLPAELWEAARIDGCKEMRYFVRVVMPLSTPVIAAMAINSFIGIYNAYFWPMLVTTTDNMRTIQTGMAYLMSSDTLRYGEVLAGSVLSLIIPAVAFLFGQEYIIKGMTAGAVKS